MNKPTTGQPRPSVLDPRFKYTNAMNTDIRKTWAKYGWVPKEKTVMHIEWEERP